MRERNKLTNLIEFLASDEFSFDGFAQFCRDRDEEKNEEGQKLDQKILDTELSVCSSK